MTLYCFGWLGWDTKGERVPIIAIAASVETARALLAEREAVMIADRRAWHAQWTEDHTLRWHAAYGKYHAAIKDGSMPPPDPSYEREPDEVGWRLYQAGVLFEASPERAALVAESATWPPRPHATVPNCDSLHIDLARPPDWQVPAAQPGAYWADELGTT